MGKRWRPCSTAPRGPNAAASAKPHAGACWPSTPTRIAPLSSRRCSMDEPLSIVFLGLSISSSWGNGHATTYRGLVRELAKAGHRITFLERDLEWYRNNRDAPSPEGATLHLYESVDALR